MDQIDPEVNEVKEKVEKLSKMIDERITNRRTNDDDEVNDAESKGKISNGN